MDLKINFSYVKLIFLISSFPLIFHRIIIFIRNSGNSIIQLKIFREHFVIKKKKKGKAICAKDRTTKYTHTTIPFFLVVTRRGDLDGFVG